MQEGKISTLSDFDKFYMDSTPLVATNTMALSVSPFLVIFQNVRGTMIAAKQGAEP